MWICIRRHPDLNRVRQGRPIRLLAHNLDLLGPAADVEFAQVSIQLDFELNPHRRHVSDLAQKPTNGSRCTRLR
jgi:hypothetical protein